MIQANSEGFPGKIHTSECRVTIVVFDQLQLSLYPDCNARG